MNGVLNEGSLIGTLSSSLDLEGKIEATTITGIITIGSGNYLDYSGSYDIIPQVDEQTLQTKNKVLRENMVVEGIPYFETSNEYGYTIYIGNEVEINGN